MKRNIVRNTKMYNNTALLVSLLFQYILKNNVTEHYLSQKGVKTVKTYIYKQICTDLS